MTDAFAELGLERRPWLDPQTIRSRYHELAARAHPDKAGGDEAVLVRLNSARRTLSSHGLRLSHLAALAFPGSLPPPAPAPDWDVFLRVATVAGEAKSAAEKKARASSALETAVAATKISALKNELSNVERLTAAHRAELESATREADRTWPSTGPDVLWKLAEQWTFWNRWNEALREAETLLASA